MSDRKAVIKNADMSEEMQQDAVDCATQVRYSKTLYVTKSGLSFADTPHKLHNVHDLIYLFFRH